MAFFICFQHGGGNSRGASGRIAQIDFGIDRARLPGRIMAHQSFTAFCSSSNTLKLAPRPGVDSA